MRSHRALFRQQPPPGLLAPQIIRIRPATRGHRQREALHTRQRLGAKSLHLRDNEVARSGQVGFGAFQGRKCNLGIVMPLREACLRERDTEPRGAGVESLRELARFVQVSARRDRRTLEIGQHEEVFQGIDRRAGCAVAGQGPLRQRTRLIAVAERHVRLGFAPEIDTGLDHQAQVGVDFPSLPIVCQCASMIAGLGMDLPDLLEIARLFLSETVLARLQEGAVEDRDR